MSEQFTLKLNSPITDEQWDAITDVDFDHTEEIFFHTKHSKEVTFVKQKKGAWIELEPKGVWTSVYHCSECGGAVMSCKVDLPKYCGHCGARMEGLNETD